MPDIGMPELLIVLGVIVLFFGSKKLPELARGLGEAKKAFEDGSRETRRSEPAGPAEDTPA